MATLQRARGRESQGPARAHASSEATDGSPSTSTSTREALREPPIVCIISIPLCPLSLPLSAAGYHAAICGVTSPALSPSSSFSMWRGHPDPESHRYSHVSASLGLAPCPGTTPSHLAISSLAQHPQYVILFHWSRRRPSVNFSALRNSFSAADKKGCGAMHRDL
jgi:hypothetical protein